ncbi:Toll/interleukin-1 receptor domain-containing protein [Tanacetum coccineum]
MVTWKLFNVGVAFDDELFHADRACCRWGLQPKGAVTAVVMCQKGSSWCLDELVKIMECQKTSEQTTYPVFYDVEPTEIRGQSVAIEKAFEKHENKEAVGKWRKALNVPGKLVGWEPKKTANGDESKLIQIIVDFIFQKICSSSPSVDENLVGMETRIEDVLSSLELDDDDVRMIGKMWKGCAICPLDDQSFGFDAIWSKKHEWIDTLERRRTIPLMKTLEKLELSYKSLDDEYKQIFLDVACLLKGWKKDHAIRALESCGFHAKNGLRVLEQRSLINIPEDGKLWMHA